MGVNFTSCEPSRFIEEIDEQFLDIQVPTSKISTFSKPNNVRKDFANEKIYNTNRNLKKVSTIKNQKLDNSDLDKNKIGTEVNHEKFGKGKVVQLLGDTPNVKATVYFPSSGQKPITSKICKTSNP